ncbi:MAG: ATP-binding cassette domain-containing protein [Chitinophagales bacterium]|nr:ATP-binding cassette domain-containing protein [Chitinophagales bacterium]
MSEKILKALMQLFAITANAERLTERGRVIVEIFLQQQLSLAHVKKYIDIFDEQLLFLQGKAESVERRKRVAVNSVKVLRICTDINSELEQKQKYIVLIRLIEFVYSSDEPVSAQESDFLSTVAEVFNIKQEEFKACLSLASAKRASEINDAPSFLLVAKSFAENRQDTRQLLHDNLEGMLAVFFLKSAGILFAKYFGNEQLTLNGQALTEGRINVLSSGSVIRSSKIQPVYFSELARCFLKDESKGNIHFAARDLEFIFKNGKKGLHRVSFSASSGNLVGIMGSSGAGKSTLLNILNGNLVPAKGGVFINGINIHADKEKIEGIVGYVPQDDLLLEELTVFQNLFFNSKLCFGNLDDAAITAKVNEQLESLGLTESKDLKVGDVLNKTISGGQRKRLNIALELIRKPQVLFVDEPTSGLSSLDSENVMDLLKQLSASGNLVFVVIHQPSSDIFKLFDKLLLLDTGGYPVYFGNPADSLLYFKSKAHHADADESECQSCGNINSEQLFSIIESKVMDEFGNPTAERKISPQEWNQFYKESFSNEENAVVEKQIEHSSFAKPSRMRQVGVFIKRDVLSKLRNTQYMLINFLEAPVLALILAYVLKYSKEGAEFTFRENINLPAFLFISVIVALFMGLTVSAEEIIRDRKILKREAFLNLSRSGYLLSKICILFVISALQTFSYVLISNEIFGIHEMGFAYWLILFSVSCAANLTGLNISASFNSVVTIYILVPFLMIPQIIFSGVMVKFEDLNPQVTNQSRVPLIGEVMVSRWGFEALAVNQFTNNSYQKHFFAAEKQISNAIFKKDFWLIKMNDKLDSVFQNGNSHAAIAQVQLLKNELRKESFHSPNENLADLISVSMDSTSYKKVKRYFEGLKKQYIGLYKSANAKKDSVIQAMTKSEGRDKLSQLKNGYTNENLNNILLNANNLHPIVEHEDDLIQRFRPVYMDGVEHSFLRAPFYVSRKNVFGYKCDTYWVNLIVIWTMILLLMLTLYFNLLKKILDKGGKLFERMKGVSLFRKRIEG